MLAAFFNPLPSSNILNISLQPSFIFFFLTFAPQPFSMRFSIVFLLLFVLLSPFLGFGANTDSLSIPHQQAGKNSWIAVPIMFYQEETSFGAGVSGGYYFTRHRTNKVSNIQGVAIYTSKHQALVSILPKIFSKNLQTYYSGHVRASYYPDKFFGVGSTTLNSQEENFTSRGFSILAQGQHLVYEQLMVGAQVGVEQSKIVRFDENGALTNSSLPGTLPYFAAGFGFLATWDSRNNNFYATKGAFYKVSLMANSKIFGSDLNYNRLVVDFRNFYPTLPKQAVAVQLFADLSWGETPFQSLPSLGGNELLRGYYEGRYRDKMLIALQSEYRFSIIWRIKGTLFASTGNVAPTLGRFNIKQAKYTYGGGLRFRVNPALVHVRCDLGVTSTGKVAIYFTASEAF